MKSNLEQACASVGNYLSAQCRDLPVSDTHHMVFTVGELAMQTGSSPRMIGKLRVGYRRALAQAMTPGRNPEFAVEPQSCFGRSAIAVRRIAPHIHTARGVER